MNNTMIILNEEIEIKEYNGKRVITAYDIAKLHGRDVKRINELFKNNRNRFIENEDYFIANKNLINWSFKTSSENISSNLKELILFTESGYLLLTKVMNDDRSWGVQRILTKSYFKIQELKNAIESGEIRIEKTEENKKLISAEELNNITNLIMKFDETESTVTKKMIIETVSKALGGETKFGYEKPENAITKIPEGTVTGDIAAEIIIRRHNLKNFSVGSMRSLASIDKLNEEPLVYLYYDEETFNKRYYYTEAFIRQLIRNIITNKQRAKKYGCEYMEKIPEVKSDMVIEFDDF